MLEIFWRDHRGGLLSTAVFIGVGVVGGLAAGRWRLCALVVALACGWLALSLRASWLLARAPSAAPAELE